MNRDRNNALRVMNADEGKGLRKDLKQRGRVAEKGLELKSG
jgi:hypothetical protein